MKVVYLVQGFWSKKLSGFHSRLQDNPRSGVPLFSREKNIGTPDRRLDCKSACKTVYSRECIRVDSQG